MAANRLGFCSSAGLVFTGTGLERTIRRFLIVCGVLCFAGALGPALGNMRVQLIGVLGYAGLLPVVAFLLAWMFARDGSEN